MSEQELAPDTAELSAAAALDPLVVGTTLLERYTIVAVLSADDGVNTYRVAEMRRCPNCGVENEGSLTHCGFCGNELPAPRTFVLTERRSPPNGALLPASFMLDDLTYTFARDMDEQPQLAPALHLDVAYLSDPGLARGTRGDPNEDAVLVMELNAQHATGAPVCGLFAIADGIGGAEAGEVASWMTIQTVAHRVLSSVLAPDSAETGAAEDMVREALRTAIAEANTKIIAYAHAHNIMLGSTLTLALLIDDHAHIANVGDSRTYLYRDETLTRLTRDHSYVEQLIARGAISDEEARVHPQRNLILKSLGDASGFEPDIFPPDAEGLALRAGDVLVLCCDGLWEMVTDAEIANVLAHASDARGACAQLVSFANAAGGADNISVIVVRVLE